MGLSIKNDEAEHLARELAALKGESLTETILIALRERRARHRAEAPPEDLAQALLDLGRRYRRRPLIDAREPDEILYDDQGLPS